MDSRYLVINVSPEEKIELESRDRLRARNADRAAARISGCEQRMAAAEAKRLRRRERNLQKSS
ncbi:hypothetical protein OOZ54_13080 [Rhodopseudomonas palustris]|uniref:hypothetical protein n=1 Tax=Rhodopseudomonas palustris TaxID=1076 RepID=UPI0022F0F21C|nr:hypothetical protein [Rhodopseudomonas palustris]WBU27612.1 hypothetical protein OOZ54_13080 [Rhodopseudomonas palustris]